MVLTRNSDCRPRGRLPEIHQGQVLKTFNSDVFTGLAIETDDDNLDTINQAVGVAQVWTASLAHIPEFETLSTRSLLGDAANYSSYVHQYTGVAKHHAEGNLGQGIKIAVIDSGIDYSHEAVCYFRYGGEGFNAQLSAQLTLGP